MLFLGRPQLNKKGLHITVAEDVYQKVMEIYRKQLITDALRGHRTSVSQVVEELLREGIKHHRGIQENLWENVKAFIEDKSPKNSKKDEGEHG